MFDYQLSFRNLSLSAQTLGRGSGWRKHWSLYIVLKRIGNTYFKCFWIADRSPSSLN